MWWINVFHITMLVLSIIHAYVTFPDVTSICITVFYIVLIVVDACIPSLEKKHVKRHRDEVTRHRPSAIYSSAPGARIAGRDFYEYSSSKQRAKSPAITDGDSVICSSSTSAIIVGGNFCEYSSNTPEPED